MKVVETPQVIERHGVVNTIKCKLAQNAHSFRMLARQYSDPIKAIIQEISANCIDAHVRVGKKDTPFEVSLPNKLDPHIRFRDYGCSMTQDVIENVYANYMQSDKQHTNDEVGYFGIGSKTPLAYTDSFNITTYLDGKMRMYTMCYDENSIPEINQFGEYDTDEPNGVEVSFAVNEEDWQKFYDAARTVYSFYSTLPVINSTTDFQVKEYTKLLSGNGWFVSGSASYGSYVIMGNIGYKIDTYKFFDSVGQMLRNGLHFVVPVGSIHMTPSRENLEYNSETINTINKFVNEIYEEAAALVAKKLNTAKSAWEASILYQSFSHAFSGLSFSDNATLKKNCKFAIKVTVDVDKCIYKYTRHKRQNTVPTNQHILNNVLFVIKNTKAGFDRDCRNLANTENKVIYLVEEGVNRNDLLTKIGAIESDNAVCYSSELPAAPKAPSIGSSRQRKLTKTVKVYLPSGNSSKRNRRNQRSKYWESYEIDIKNGEHIYVYLNRLEVNIDLLRLFSQLNSLNITPPEIIGLAAENQKFSSRKNFISIYDWTRDKIKSLIDADFTSDYSIYHTYNSISNVEIIGKIFNKATVKINNEENPLRLLMEYVNSFEKTKRHDFIEKIIAISHTAEYTLEGKKLDKDILQLRDDIVDKYPLVNYYICNNCGFGGANEQRANEVVFTVNALDSVNKEV